MKCSHYLAVAAIAIGMTTSGITPSGASSFDFNQYFRVVDPTFWGSQNVVYNYNSQFLDVTPYVQGAYSFYFALPFDADLGLFHYSYADGRYVEAVYLNDYAI